MCCIIIFSAFALMSPFIWYPYQGHTFQWRVWDFRVKSHPGAAQALGSMHCVMSRIHENFAICKSIPVVAPVKKCKQNRFSLFGVFCLHFLTDATAGKSYQAKLEVTSGGFRSNENIRKIQNIGCVITFRKIVCST